ncbi:MAG: 4-hydroxy-3-methylbut-2-enyl diphosphate reductase [Ignavibacteria bacterium]|nr:4-hydroxy-3-methylbut-2-enyl diphosphate reductase [Ignavibacteria bacterium]MBI3765224.1 4-hydroxy-3-methylbut-2-enyl diphosphate reductase [Ignavibacteriales bacterium]
MKVSIDKSAGFCWGVIRTIDIAESELESNQPGEKLYVLGDIIHNPMEIERLQKKGLKTISHADLPNMRDGKVLIRAHGEPPSTFEIAERLGVEIVDATCPVVWKVQERIKKFYDQGYQVVIYGKKDHAEVIGLVGHTNGEAIVIKSVEEIDQVDLSRKTVLFSQTTMDKQTFYLLKEEFQKRIKEFIVDSFDEQAREFHAKDTICGQVFGRDKKLREFAQQNDIMIFVAGRNSSNGKVLFHICQEANSRTYFVETEAELQPQWFEGVKTVGISGATSTPQWLMERIKQSIEETFGVSQPAIA